MRASAFLLWWCVFAHPVAAQVTDDEKLARWYEVGEAASDILESECRQGDAWACGELGYRAMFGKNEPQDFDRAASYLGPACRGGAGWACHNAAQLAEKGLGGVAKDLNVIIGLHASACDAGIGLSCRRAGEVLVGQSSSEYRQMGVDMLLNGCLSSTWADVSNCFSLYMVRDRDALSGMTANVPPQAELLSRACDPSQRDNEAYGNACRAAQSACKQGEEAFCPAAFAAARLAC